MNERNKRDTEGVAMSIEESSTLKVVTQKKKKKKKKNNNNKHENNNDRGPNIFNICKKGR